MELIKSSYKIESVMLPYYNKGDINNPTFVSSNDLLPRASLRHIEKVGRTCYKSESELSQDSAALFSQMLLTSDPPHMSVIEHSCMSVRFVIDRGISHELVRHRLASYSQESTRYINYKKKGVTFIIPPWINIQPGIYTDIADSRFGSHSPDSRWARHMFLSEKAYLDDIADGRKPEQARQLLPTSLKTEVVMWWRKRQRRS